MEITEILEKVHTPCSESENKARYRWSKVAIPLGSLGKLETYINKIAGIQRTANIDISKPVVCVMCADNGVVAQGVTQTGSDVTGIVAECMAKNESSVCIMAHSIGADVVAVDIGIDHEIFVPGLVNKKVMMGTHDMTKGAVMTRIQSMEAINVGIEMVKNFKKQGYNIIITGEMGIGNTTTSSAVASVLLSKNVEEVTGRGAGLSNEGLNRKVNAIKKAIEINKPDKNDPIDVLCKVGGLDIAGMTGLYIGGAIYDIPVVIDGFISSVSALIAKLLVPGCFEYMIASHVSAEPAGMMMLETIGFEPMITCDMRLGEGTGGVTAVSLLQMGAAVYSSMNEFEDINIEQYTPQGE